jgi:hypothetical protein
MGRAFLGGVLVLIAASGCRPQLRDVEYIGPPHQEGPEHLLCRGTMKAVPADSAIPSSADMAVVVFVRARDIRPEVDVLIVDDEEQSGGPGRFLGESEHGSYFAVTLRPGEHRFLAWTTDAGALPATLAPGKTYYVDVEIVFDWFHGPTRPLLMAMPPNLGYWDRLPSWLGRSKPLAPDERQGQACLTRDPAKLGHWTGRARAALARDEDRDLDFGRVRPEHGR